MFARAIRTAAMSDHPYPDPLNGGDRLRSLEDDRFAQRRPGNGDRLDGLREISQAWNENRTTAYLLRKSFSDPISRWFFIVVSTLIVLGLAVLFYQ